MIGRGGTEGSGERLCLFLASLLLAAVCLGSPVQAASTGTQLNLALNRVMATPNSPPGLSMQIVRNGTSRYYRRGVANLETGEKPRINHRFRIASTSKAFSGAVTLNLVARGKLRLRSPIGEILPGALPNARRVTLAQALQHTGGLPEYLRSKGFADHVTVAPQAYVAPRRILSWVRDSGPEHPPGTRYEYSNTHNIVAGLMAEKTTGLPYLRQIRLLGQRAGGLDATFMPATVRIPGPYLHGYEIVPGQPPEDVSHAMNPSGAWASGGIVSTLPNLSRFFRAYVAGRFFGQGRIKARVTQAQRRWRPGESEPAGPGVNQAGLGLFRYVTRCGTMFGHTGSFPGYRTFAAASADGRRSVAFVVNAQIVPDSPGIPNAAEVSARIRQAQTAAVCHALR